MSGLLGNVVGELEGLLETAAWRGVTFEMINVREQAGRRVIQFLFPHSDAVNWQDLGAMQGDMTITGIIAGDDYVIRAERMRQALLGPGPGMLQHPWLGEIAVILTTPGELSYSLVELGVARLQFVVRRYDAPSPPPTDTLGALLTKADALIDKATLMAEQVLAPVALPLALYASLTSFLDQAHGVWDSVVGTGDTGDIAACAQPSLNALSAGVEAPVSNTDTTFADTVAALLFATAAAIAVAAQEPTPPAIGSASGVTLSTDPVVDPTQAVTVLLAVATAIAALSTTPAASVTGSAIAPLAVATAAAILAQAVSVGVSLPFDSQQAAITWRGTLDDALAQLAGQVVAIGAAQPIAANAVYQALSDMRSALAADINALIGRLPAVVTITTNRTMSAWLIALYLSGDTPSDMVTTLQDVVARNGVINPGVVPAGMLEVLQS